MNSDRLQKLVLMLSSEHDGEIVAAAKAIGRYLREDGHDWHWLVDRVVSNGKQPKVGRATANPDELINDLDAQILDELNDVELRQREREFVNSMIERMRSYGKRTFFSTAQRKFLQGIHQRVFDR